VNKIQLLILFGIALAGATTGSSIGGLMPVYVAQLGADAYQTGVPPLSVVYNYETPPLGCFSVKQPGSRPKSSLRVRQGAKYAQSSPLV
jgi:hypothetical protein